MSQKTNHQLSSAERGELLNNLEERFRMFPQRHEGLNWPTVMARLEAHPDKLWSLSQMELSTLRPPAGSRPHHRSGRSAALSSVISDTGRYLFIITAQRLTMPQGDSVAY